MVLPLSEGLDRSPRWPDAASRATPPTKRPVRTDMQPGSPACSVPRNRVWTWGLVFGLGPCHSTATRKWRHASSAMDLNPWTSWFSLFSSFSSRPCTALAGFHLRVDHDFIVLGVDFNRLLSFPQLAEVRAGRSDTKTLHAKRRGLGQGGFAAV